MSGNEPSLDVVIRCKTEVARRIHLFELARADGAALPPAAPGSHIAVETPAGANRWYSICSTGGDGRTYSIAVKREADGRGGSVSMVDDTEVGTTLRIGEPECEFDLVEADAYLLIAGGIGITPIYAMWQRLVDAAHPDVKLIYLTRSPADTPFLDEITHSGLGDSVIIHHSAEAGERFDFWDLLEKPTVQHVYCCGPKSLMNDIRDMTGHWPSSRLHFEDFKPVQAVRADDRPFSVRLAGTETIFEVGESETLLDALRRHHVSVHSSCESGTCGSCKIPYVQGVVEHRDLVLDEKESATHMMACVSRAMGDEITIDVGAVGEGA